MPDQTPQRMTTGEAAVASLIAHGLDTIYALPGVHNDPLFDALYRARNSIRTIHTRHEQGAGYMALGAALATGKPQAYAVVPGPGLLNSGTALLTAYSANCQVLAMIGQIPQAMIGRGLGYLHEVRDQTGLLERLVDHVGQIRAPYEAPARMAEAMHAMASGRRGPAAIECAMDQWGRRGPVAPTDPLPPEVIPLDEDALAAAAKKLGAAKRPMIVVGGGALGASAEVTRLAEMLQAPVLAHRRGRGVIDGRSPFSVTLPLGNELWGEADVVLAIGTRLLMEMTEWGIDDDLAIIRVGSDPTEADRLTKPALSLLGDAREICARLVDLVPAHNNGRASRRAEMEQRQGALADRMRAKIGPQLAFLDAIRDVLPEDGILVEEVTQMGFAARVAWQASAPRTFISAGYQDALGWGFATALGVQSARPDVPVVSIAGDGGFMFAATELATAVHHRIPLVTIVFADGAFGNVKRIQEEMFEGRTIASDLTNPDFVRFAESFGAAAERAETPEALKPALERALARRDGPTLIEVPVGAFPSPWGFIKLPLVRRRRP